jgi:hypothetical protein
LGVNWFKQHNPVTFDFVDRSLTLGIEGTLHTFHDHMFPKKKFHITSEKCNKLIEQGATGYILLYATEETGTKDSEPCPSLPDAINNILHQF